MPVWVGHSCPTTASTSSERSDAAHLERTLPSALDVEADLLLPLSQVVIPTGVGATATA